MDENSAYKTLYSIDGFRSLRDFSIELHPGLNVLVGPNGSGKTNFIDFLDFLDHAVYRDISTAVSSIGGIARVFSQEIIKKTSPRIYCKICGVAEIPPKDLPDDTEKRFFNYEYELEFRFSRRFSAIYISREVLKLKKIRELDETHLANVVVGTITRTHRSPSPEIDPVIKVSNRLYTQNPRNPLRVTYRSHFKDSRTLIDQISQIVLAPDESFLTARTGLSALSAVGAAITRGGSFNIDPVKARTPDDLTRAPVIARDGSGLSSTLYHLQMSRKETVVSHRTRLRRFTKESLDMVIEWTRLVFPELNDISVVQDPHTGKYLGYLVVGNDKNLRIPLQAASDGTLKWLCFVCLLIAPGQASSIEEPENFLHPKMQQFLVQLVREKAETDKRSGHFVVSTHSETLINQCRPNELTIFRFEGNRTVCGPIKNIDRVQQEINRTGFGLGYYYASNSLS